MRPDYFKAFIKGIFLLQIFIIIVLLGVGLNITYPSVTLAFNPGVIPFTVNLNQEQATVLFRDTGYALAGWEQDNLIQYARHYYAETVPRDIICTNIQALADSDFKGEVAESTTPSSAFVIEPPAYPDIEENRKIFGAAKLVCYCTHSSESYIPDSGKAKTEGSRGLVNSVAETLVKEIAHQGLKAEFVSTIHDFPNYDRSYTNSRQTVNNILKDDQVIALFDIHRDSIPGEAKGNGVIIKGRRAAQILIIVGTDQRKDHPHWKKNLEFAQKLQLASDKLYPGLIKSVRTQAGTYNQEYHDHALLLEFGRDYNSLEEAQYAARLFSRVLVEVLKEESNR